MLLMKGYDGNAARWRAGFTAVEMLAAVAIIAVMLAVAVPNAVAYQRSLEASEVNGKAEQVYNAAQFQLTSLKTAGRLGVLAPLDADKVSPTPSDYPNETGASSLRYAVKGGAVTNDYLMPVKNTMASAGSMPGAYVIELSPASGEVYAVFYWEDGAENASGAKFAGTSEATIEEFYQSIKAYRPASAGTYLSEHGIGYFNGGLVSEVPDEPDDPDGGGASKFDPSELNPSPINGENLEVPLAYPSDIDDTDFDMDELKMTIHVQQVNNDGWEPPAHQVMYRLNGGASNAPSPNSSGQYIDIDASDFTPDGDRLAYILDSLETDAGLPMSIESRTDGLIERGTNVKITVYVEYEGFTVVYGPYMENSIFGTYDSSTRTVEVSSIRHLVNLASAGAQVNQVTTLSITSDIVREEDAGPIEPIDLTGVLGTSNGAYIKGNNHVIEGVVVGSESAPVDNAGLFSHLRVNIQDLTLKNVTVHGEDNVGALIGNQINSGVSIANCKVVGGTVTGRSNVGGLVGCAVGGTYSNCSSSAAVVSTGGSTGGLIGAATTSSFTNCVVGSVASAASVTGQNCSRVGGFIGELQTQGDTITGCQAYANVSGLDYVGGFFGQADEATWSVVENCQAAVTYDASGAAVFQKVSGRSYVGGFAGGVQQMNSLKGCLAQVDVTGSGDCVGGFAGLIASAGGENISDCSATGVSSGGATRQPTYSGAGGNIGAFVGRDDYKNLKNCTSTAVRA